MRKALPAAAAVSAIICASCLPVPFDLALSQGAEAASHMTRDNPSLLVVDQGFDPSEQGFAFYPAVLSATMGGGMDYTGGFVTSTRGLGQNVTAVRKDSSSGHFIEYGSASLTTANPDAHFPAAVGWPVQAMSGPTGSSYFLQYTFDALDPLSDNRYSVKKADDVALTFNPLDDSDMHNRVNLDFSPFDSVVVGASINADTSGQRDLAHWLAFDVNNPGSYLEILYTVSESGLGGKATPRGSSSRNLSAFLPASVSASTFTRCAYFYDDNLALDPSRLPNRSVASWWDLSRAAWVAYEWWEEPSTGSGTFSYKQLPIGHRLDGLLSTGCLLSTEGGTGRLYDLDGKLLAAFPMGNLVYLGEKFVGGQGRVYFSQCTIYDHALHFNVYWIATDQLATLAD